MKIRIYSIICAALILSCCTKAEEGISSDGVYAIRLQTGHTKLSYGDFNDGSYTMQWQTGDAVVINGNQVSDALSGEYDGKTSATFTTSEKVYFPLSVVFPASVNAGNGRIAIPEVQAADPAKVANGYAVLTGYAAKEGTVAMDQACGYIRVSLTGTQTLKSVSLKAMAGRMIAGTFTVNARNGSISPVAGEEGSSTIKLTTDAVLSASATEFTFAVPAGTYPEGFKLTAEDSSGQKMTKTMYSTSGKNVTGGIMTRMQSLAFSPSAPETEILEVSESAVVFPSKEYAAATVSACAGDEDVTVTSEGLEWCTASVPESISAGKTVIMTFTPSSANISDLRSGKVTFTGKTSGTKIELPVSQGNLYTASYGFPAKWFTPNLTSEMTSGWEKEGYITCTDGAGVGLSYLSLGTTVAGHSPKPTMYSGNIAGTGMLSGDYFQFSCPVIDVKKGTDLDFMITISTKEATSPKYWLVEWYDGNEWQSQPRYTAEDGTKYSFYIKYFSSGNYRTHIESYTLKNDLKNDFMRIRIRAVGTLNNGGGTLGKNSASVWFSPGNYVAAYLTCYADEATPIADTHKMSQYGNSITYYHGSAFMLKELARREGHQLDVRINLKGSQEFEHHLSLEFSKAVTAEGGYDFAVMNDGSYFHAEYAAGSKSALVGITPKYTPEEILYWQKEMTKAIKAVCPDCQTLITSEHSYSRKAADDNYLGFGSFENFDTYQWKGAQMLGEADPNLNWMAPAGKGFARARSNYGFTSAYNYMQHTDNYHPNLYGAYMRACITYLTLFGGSFGENAADCCVPAADAAKLRQAAMDIVNDSTRNQFRFH